MGYSSPPPPSYLPGCPHMVHVWPLWGEYLLLRPLTNFLSHSFPGKKSLATWLLSLLGTFEIHVTIFDFLTSCYGPLPLSLPSQTSQIYNMIWLDRLLINQCSISLFDPEGVSRSLSAQRAQRTSLSSLKDLQSARGPATESRTIALI